MRVKYINVNIHHYYFLCFILFYQMHSVTLLTVISFLFLISTKYNPMQPVLIMFEVELRGPFVD